MIEWKFIWHWDPLQFKRQHFAGMLGPGDKEMAKLRAGFSQGYIADMLLKFLHMDFTLDFQNNLSFKYLLRLAVICKHIQKGAFHLKRSLLLQSHIFLMRTDLVRCV